MKRRRRVRQFNGVMKNNLFGVFVFVILLCGFLTGRLVWINNVKGSEYGKRVLSQQAYSSRVIVAERGAITDRNGIVLARSEKTYNVILDPDVILTHDYYMEPTLEALNECLGYDKNTMLNVINGNPTSKYLVYERNIDYSKVSEFNKYKSSHKFVVGVWFEEQYSRTYPYGNFASHVLGYATKDGGRYGIEQYYDKYLTGTEGQEYGYYDPELNSQKTTKDAVNGDTLVTTLDFNIQTVIQEKITKFQETTGCENIGVIVMNPQNGEIYGMASNYEYDLNNPRSLEGLYTEEELAEMSDEDKMSALYKMWRNFCISDTYEPGSTFKTITVASALEEGVISPSDQFDCQGYSEKGGWKITCNNKDGHGRLTLAEALMKSCNCALMDIAEKLGPNKFYLYQKIFGFGAKTGIDLTGEATGIIIPKEKLKVTELATSSFGTTFNVTMVQVAAAYASILNGGDYYIPHVVKQIKTADGITVLKEDQASVRETVSSTTTEFIHDALYMTVEKGTATPAKVKGYLIGGKTGTAQKRPRTEKKYVVSFVGFAPVENPQVMTYVVIDEVHDESLVGSSSPATKMTAEIMNEILPYLGMYPVGDIVYTVDLDLLQELDSNIHDEVNEGNLPEDYDENAEEKSEEGSDDNSGEDI